MDQTGGRTAFAGANVRVYASGYSVDCVAPGGAHVQESGTSMATPQVTNLAARVIALDPMLAPERTVALIQRASEPGDEPGIRLINPKKAVAMHQKWAAAELGAAAPSNGASGR